MTHRRGAWILAIAGGLGLGQLLAQVRGGSPIQGVPQATLFGVVATPGSSEVDKELKGVAPQLRRLFPGHGFKLAASRSKPLPIGQTLNCPLDDGWSASVTMANPVDVEGKVNLRFTLERPGEPSIQRIIRTPPNQIFFADVGLPGGKRLILGMGAR